MWLIQKLEKLLILKNKINLVTLFYTGTKSGGYGTTANLADSLFLISNQARPAMLLMIFTKKIRQLITPEISRMIFFGNFVENTFLGCRPESNSPNRTQTSQ